MATAARMPMMATTIMSSMSVKPRIFLGRMGGTFSKQHTDEQVTRTVVAVSVCEAQSAVSREPSDKLRR